MSREKGTVMLGLVFLEKILGFILSVVGVILAYYTSINLSGLGAIGYLFLIAGITIAVAGLLLIIAKTE
ncbi:MAG: hypothetical protein QXX94_02835 [Candidatus Bathyarchaeia archaeon]